MQNHDWSAMLIARHRSRFAACAFVDVPTGWLSLVENLVAGVDSQLSPDEPFTIYRIARGGGELAMLFNAHLGTSKFVHRLFLAAQELSKHRCEICGQSGGRIGHGDNIRVRCVEHREANDV